MKKKLMLFTFAATLVVVPVTAHADEKDDRIAELEAQVTELQATIDDLTKQLEGLLNGSDQDSYSLGETWTVPGQWRITLNEVEETADRNEYADTDPAAVYVLTYTYENLGYESDYMDGLFVDLSQGIVDAAGSMGYEYPGDVTYYPQETPVGASCKAQICIGVDNPGDFQVHYSAYDGEENEQKTVFSISVK